MTADDGDRDDGVVVNGPEDETWTGTRRLAHGRGRRTAAAAEDLQGVAGRGPEAGPQSAEADAAEPVEHADQRAAGDASAMLAAATAGIDGRGRVDLPRPGRRWRWTFTTSAAVAGPTGQAGVHPEEQRKTASARHSGDARPRAAGPGDERAGARVGGPVRAAILRVPARTRLPRRDRGHLLDAATATEPEACVGPRRGPGRGVRPHRPRPSARRSSARSPRGD